MNEDTGTDDVAAGLGAEEAQPEPTTKPAGESVEGTQPDQPSEETNEEPDATGTTDGEDDLKWAEKKGLDLSDPAKVASILRNADRKVSEVGRKSAMEKQVGELQPSPDADPYTVIVQNQALLGAKLAAQEFYLDHPDYKELDQDAAAILNEYKQTDPEYAHKLASNLPHLFAIARQSHETGAVAKAKDEGRLEERRLLASKQRASTTAPAASTQSLKDVDNVMAGLLAD